MVLVSHPENKGTANIVYRILLLKDMQSIVIFSHAKTEMEAKCS